MVDAKYLYQGLCGLARAHLANAMAGHLGAALVAGYFIGEEHPNLDAEVFSGIERDLDRIIAGEESLWFDQEKAGIAIADLFAAFPEEAPAAAQVSSIATALSANIDKTRQAGHNVIFSSLALRALQDHPEHATPSIINGISRLIQKFDGQTPGRGYYGKERGWIEGQDVNLADDDNFPPYENEQAMAETVIDELIRTASIRRKGYGGLFHIINHATALTELSRYGYQHLAKQGLAAHHHHLCLYRSLPNLEEELGTLQKSEHDPRTPQHWQRTQSEQWSAWLSHRVKTFYGFFHLLTYIKQSDVRHEVEDHFLYLMA